MKRILAFILSVFILFSVMPASAGGETPSGIPLSQVEDFVDEFMAEHIGHSSPGAAVVLVKDGEIILSKGYGFADLEQGIPVDAQETVFEYGSISKLFVYTTIMRLWKQASWIWRQTFGSICPGGF